MANGLNFLLDIFVKENNVLPVFEDGEVRNIKEPKVVGRKIDGSAYGSLLTYHVAPGRHKVVAFHHLQR